jgi:nucleoside-diphosphate-sugar epimerase
MSVSFNVLFGSLRAGIKTIVYASSITAMGFPFDEAPTRLPVDETMTAANNTYGLGKVLEEAMVAQLVRWDAATSITALRYTNVVAPEEYATFAGASDISYRRDLIGSYVDARDGARAVSLSLDHAKPGFEIYNIAAPDSGLDIPTARVAADWFPGTPLSDVAEFGSLMSTEKAQRELGFVAEHLWRDEYGL